MNRNRWNAFNEESKASGSLLSIKRTVFRDKVEYEYDFKNQAALDSFVQSSRDVCNVNLRARKALGYSELVHVS